MPATRDSRWMAADWPAPRKVRSVVTTRQMPGHSQPPFDPGNLGNRCGDDVQAVAANRAMLDTLFNLPTAPRWLHQVHGITVLDADADTGDTSEAEADAAVTRTPGVVLAVLTADCLPVMFCAADGSEVAIAHAGWRGLAAGVLESTLAQMRTDRSNILAWLGPSIGASSYEVGAEVHQAFIEQNPRSHSAFSATRPGHWLCDLPALARLRLGAVGVSRISSSGFDTATDLRFHSHRRNPRSGRFASLIWIEGD